MGKIVIFYKYIDIEDPHALMRWQKELCTQLGLKGRILIAKEGINATAGGADEAIQTYIATMKQHPFFYDVDYKVSEGDANCFHKLRVVVRPEIVTLGISPEKISAKNSGTALKPNEAHSLMTERPENLVILDARNNYESAIGTFKDAIVPDIENFRDFPAYIDKHIDLFKDKQVIMYCTAGVRCERATAYLKEKNVAQEVYHMLGGIHRYVEEYPDGFFRGKNYVFDGRIATKVNADILSKCFICALPCDEYTNCLNSVCNLQFIACSTCITTFANNCSQDCMQLIEQQEVPQRTVPAKTHCTLDIQTPSNNKK